MANAIVGRDGLVREHVGRAEDAAGADLMHEFLEIDDRRAAHQQEGGPWLNEVEFALAEKALIFRSRAGEDKNDARRAQQVVQRNGNRIAGADEIVGQPGVIDRDGVAKRRYQIAKFLPEIAKANDPNRRAGEHEAARIALKPICLRASAKAELGVSTGTPRA